MASTVRELRIKARKLGATNVREMTEDELEDYIAEHKNGSNGKKGKKLAKKSNLKAVKKAGKRGPGRPRKVEVDDDDDEDEVEEAPRRRGRPKGSKNKKNTTAAKRGRPAKSSKDSNKKTRRSGGPGRPVGSGTGTRVLLPEVIDWDEDFDFREGSSQAYILSQIRKVAEKYEDTSEIRQRVFDKLVDKIGDRDELTFMNRATGKPHKGEVAENRLKYIISRTMFDYAVNTGQHEGSGDSVASQPRSNGNTKTKTKKTAAKRGRPRKVVEEDDDEEETPRRRGRPKGSKNKATAKRGPGRPKGSKTKTVKRGPGRPKGSKNKVKVRG